MAIVKQYRVVSQANPVAKQILADVAFFAADGHTPLILGGGAPTASPAFTGNPTAPTPALGDNDTSIATTAFVQLNAGKAKAQIVALTAIVAADAAATAVANATAVTGVATAGAAGANPTQAEYAVMVATVNDLRLRVIELVALANDLKTKYNAVVTLANATKATSNAEITALKA